MFPCRWLSSQKAAKCWELDSPNDMSYERMNGYFLCKHSDVFVALYGHFDSSVCLDFKKVGKLCLWIEKKVFHKFTNSRACSSQFHVLNQYQRDAGNSYFSQKKKIIHDKKWITKSNWGAPIIFIYQHSNSIVFPKVHSFGLRSPTLYDVMRHRIPNTANNHKCLSQLVHHMEHT